MENITYRDQILWGTSLSMAKEDEIEQCYKFVREYIDYRSDIFHQCEDAKKIKNFLDNKWLCGASASNSHLCDKERSIKKEFLIKEIEAMASDEIDIDGENILKIFKKRKYVDIYECGRVFFLKNY